MIVLGIDPGSVKMGWGVVETSSRSFLCVDYGVVRMKSETPLIERLLFIHNKLNEIVEKHKPGAVAVESLFQPVHTNFQSIITLGQARGAALMTVAKQGCSVFEYSPAEVKKAVTGQGRAEKSQVREMLRAFLKIAEVPAEDASDALAVAMCHAFRAQSPIGLTRR